MRLAIITTHPIQYNAPFFQLLAQQPELKIKVFYTWGQSQKQVFDPGFGQAISWDLPLLEGYEYEFLRNIASNPGSHHFWGVNTPDLLPALKSFKPDYILIYGWNFFSHLLVLKFYGRSAKLLFRGDSSLLNEVKKFYIKKILRWLILNWVYRRIDYALYVGSANKEYYKQFGIKDSRLVFMPHAIDNSRFRTKDLSKIETVAANWRKELGVTAEKLVFLFVGKFEKIKNVKLLIQAFRQLEHTDIYLLLVGNGSEETNLKQIANGDNRIRFLNFQNQSKMPEVYRLGDVLVLPSFSETWGLCINEAFACSRPAIVSSKVGCAADLIEPSYTGWVFDNNNEEMLKQCLESAVEQGKTGLENMGENAYRLIQNWTYAVGISRLKEVIENEG
jgi:glycosyltransferase involved in cell wall biosynthesis